MNDLKHRESITQLLYSVESACWPHYRALLGEDKAAGLRPVSYDKDYSRMWVRPALWGHIGRKR